MTVATGLMRDWNYTMDCRCDIHVKLQIREQSMWFLLQEMEKEKHGNRRWACEFFLCLSIYKWHDQINSHDHYIFGAPSKCQIQVQLKSPIMDERGDFIISASSLWLQVKQLHTKICMQFLLLNTRPGTGDVSMYVYMKTL